MRERFEKVRTQTQIVVRAAVEFVTSFFRGWGNSKPQPTNEKPPEPIKVEPKVEQAAPEVKKSTIKTSAPLARIKLTKEVDPLNDPLYFTKSTVSEGNAPIQPKNTPAISAAQSQVMLDFRMLEEKKSEQRGPAPAIGTDVYMETRRTVAVDKVAETKSEIEMTTIIKGP